VSASIIYFSVLFPRAADALEGGRIDFLEDREQRGGLADVARRARDQRDHLEGDDDEREHERDEPRDVRERDEEPEEREASQVHKSRAASREDGRHGASA
jgi:hypothetical protein